MPKAAGTSINKALYGRTLGHYSASEVKSTFPALFEKAYIFSMVRNPWDRALSAYQFAKMGKTESMGVYRPQQYQIPEFDTFERFVCDWLPSQNLPKSDFIFQPQYRFVFDSDDVLIVDFLGKVENIESDLSEVSRQLDLRINLRRDNSTRSDSYDYRHFYSSSRMVDSIYEVYKNDIVKFDYRFE